jgi:hypothetical protein
MATIDSSIAMGYKPIQIQDPLNRMASMMQIESGQQGQQLNALKIREAEQGIENRNMLRGLDPNDPDYVNKIIRFDPALGLEIQAKQNAAKTSGLQATGLELKNFTDSMSQYRNALDMVRTPEQLLAWQDAIHKDPITGSKLASMGMPYDNVKQQLLAELQKPGGFEAALTQSKLGATKFAELQTTANAPTTAMKEFEYGQTNPAFAANQFMLKRAGAPSSQVYIPPSEKAEQIGRGQFLIKNYEEVSNAARLAAKTLPAIDTNLSLLNQGFKTGFTAETQKGAASILSALGVPEATRYATNAQVFKANLNDIVLQKQLEQKGVQTAADTEMIRATGAQLGNTPQANEFLLNVAKAQQKQTIEKRNFYDKWYQQNKTYDGAENAWFNGQGGQSLFERPELKKYNVDTSKKPAGTSGLPAGVGPDWVLKTDAKGNRAYVSPDNSKFVEVK